MIAGSRQTRRRIGVLLASFLLATLSFLILIQDESADDLLKDLEKERSSLAKEAKIQKAEKQAKEQPDVVHLVVVACEGKSKSAIDEAHNMIKSAILLSVDRKIKVKITIESIFAEKKNFCAKMIISAKKNFFVQK